MLDIHNILNKLIKWINSIGQPKTIQHNNDVEVISAIKVKKNKPVEPVNFYTTTGQTSQIKTTTKSKDVAANKYGLASTSSWVNSDEYNKIIPDDLKDLLGGGSNIAPVDINVLYNNTGKSKPKLNKNKIKNKK